MARNLKTLHIVLRKSCPLRCRRVFMCDISHAVCACITPLWKQCWIPFQAQEQVVWSTLQFWPQSSFCSRCVSCLSCEFLFLGKMLFTVLRQHPAGSVSDTKHLYVDVHNLFLIKVNNKKKNKMTKKWTHTDLSWFSMWVWRKKKSTSMFVYGWILKKKKSNIFCVLVFMGVCVCWGVNLFGLQSSFIVSMGHDVCKWFHLAGPERKTEKGKSGDPPRVRGLRVDERAPVGGCPDDANPVAESQREMGWH